MEEEEKPQSGTEKELKFDIKITNGAAKLLQKIKEKLKEDSAKDVVGLGLQVLDLALQDNSELIVKKSNGDEVRIVLKKPQDDK